MMSLSRAPVLLQRVQDRLEASGAVVELGQFLGLSAAETDVLIRLEREAR
jgi:hypothetical protein